MNEQDRIDQGYQEREESMNVTRIFIAFFLIVGLLVGIHLLLKPATASTTQSTLNLTGKCLVIPVFIFGILFFSIMVRAITGSWAERREHKQLVAERHAREIPVIQQSPPKPRVVYGPSKTKDEIRQEQTRKLQEAYATKRLAEREAETLRRRRHTQEVKEKRSAERSAQFDDWLKAHQKTGEK